MGKTQAPPQTLSKPKRSWERQHKTQNTRKQALSNEQNISQSINPFEIDRKTHERIHT
jgi:hypothetical protein